MRRTFRRRAEYEVAKRIRRFCTLLQLSSTLEISALSSIERVVINFKYVRYAEFAASIVYHYTKHHGIVLEVQEIVNKWNDYLEREGMKRNGRDFLTVRRVFRQYGRIKPFLGDEPVLNVERYYGKMLERVASKLELPEEVVDLARSYLKEFIRVKKVRVFYGPILASIYLACKSERRNETIYDVVDASQLLDFSYHKYDTIWRYVKILRGIIGT